MPAFTGRTYRLPQDVHASLEAMADETGLTPVMVLTAIVRSAKRVVLASELDLNKLADCQVLESRVERKERRRYKVKEPKVEQPDAASP